MNDRSSQLPWAMLPVTGGLLLLLVLAIVHTRGGSDTDGPSVAGRMPPVPAYAAEQARRFLGWPKEVKWTPLSLTNTPFFTLAIRPPPPPAPAAPPPATRMVKVTYRGFLETSAGVRRAVVQVADQQVVMGRGEKVLADYAAAEIELRHLTVTNAAGKSVRLEFTKPQDIEVPAK